MSPSRSTTDQKRLRHRRPALISNAGDGPRTMARHRAIVAAGLVVSLTAACTHNGVSHPRSVPIRSSAVKQLSGQELRYGAGAVPTAGIVYQPDVVVIGGGASAVRAVSGSGLTWTIDSNAPWTQSTCASQAELSASNGLSCAAMLSAKARRILSRADALRPLK